MAEAIRRVKKLRLSSQSESSLHGDIAALQDAFRIASLPGIPPQGLLLIRRLDLGGFPTRSSALALAHLIDHRIRNSAPTAIRADHGDFADQPVVWFSDDAAAVLGLVEIVAANRIPRAWYWQTLFPGWRQGMDLADTLAAIAAGLQSQVPIAAVLGQVIACLTETLSAARLLDAIKPRLAQSLLRQTGVYRGPSSLAAASSTTSALTATHGWLKPAWHPPISLALARWGNNDPRCLFLGYCALTTTNPALAVDSKMLDRIETLLGGFTAVGLTPAAKAAGAAATRSASAATAEPPAMGEFSPTVPHEKNRSRQLEKAAPAVAGRSRHEATPVSAASKQPRKSATDDHAAAGNEPDTDDGEQSHCESITVLPDPDGVVQQPPTAKADTEPEAVSFNGLVACEYAGLALVIKLLELLAIDRLLEQNPALAEMNLPALIVTDIARRLGVPPDHPLLQALSQPPPVETSLDSFECPASWLQLIAAPGGKPARLHRFETTAPGLHCFLTDRSRRILLYAGAGDLPRWARQHRIARHDGVHSIPVSRDLSPGVQLLIGRYLRRYGDISLRQLVRRPGRLASTRTHLDVLFDFEQTDIRIRKSGLDIDPGWVPWLARVVRFHYQDGELIDV